MLRHEIAIRDKLFIDKVDAVDRRWLSSYSAWMHMHICIGRLLGCKQICSLFKN